MSLWAICDRCHTWTTCHAYLDHHDPRHCPILCDRCAEEG